MQKQLVIERYEKLLMGKAQFFLNGTEEEKEMAVRTIVRYCISNMLRWTPREAYDHLTWDIICLLKLDEILKYVRFPYDIDPVIDPDYVVYLAFPETSYDYGRQVLRIYRRIQNGEMKQFPKKLFTGPYGREKARVLLNEVIETSIPVSGVFELYQLFADSAKINPILKKAQIFYVQKKLYGSALDYLHDALPDDQKDEFLYSFFQYRNVSKAIARSLYKRRKAKPKTTKNAAAKKEKTVSDTEK